MSSQVSSSMADRGYAGHSIWRAQIRALNRADISGYASHLLRLDQDCRRARFGNYASDKFLRAYVEHCDSSNTLVLGCFEGSEICGATEIRSLAADWCPRAELAFSVEKAWRGRGVGTALMFQALLAATHLSVQQIFLSCHAFNRPMVRIAERAAAHLDFSECECLATIAVHKNLQPDVGQS